MSLSKRLSLTRRDYALFAFLNEHGFSSIKWICEKFWGGKNLTHVHRRLRALKRENWVEPILSDTQDPIGYRLTRTAHRRLGTRQQTTPNAHTRRSFETNYQHEDALVGMSLVFKALPSVTNYQTEEIVRRVLVSRYGRHESSQFGFKVPDALFTLNARKGPVRIVLEFERAAKSKAYRSKTLVRLITSDDFDLVFMVFSESKTMKLYQDTIQELREKEVMLKVALKDNGIYFALLENLMRDRERCEFQGEGQTFRLCDL